MNELYVIIGFEVCFIHTC